jgi:putative aldouronate transport system permease protein
MLLPALVCLILFSYVPMAGLVMAFQNYKPLLGFLKSPFVGLGNYHKLFALNDFPSLVRNTLVIAGGKMLLSQAASLTLALLLHEVRNAYFKRTVQTITYALYFLSWIVFGAILLDMLAANGLINNALRGLGIGTVSFLTDPQVFPLTLIGTSAWKGFGYGAVLYLAALSDVDPQLYEAAAIDGAGRLGRLRHVTLPGIAPTIAILAILNLGWLLDAGLEQVLVLYNPLVYSTGDVIGTWVYRVGLVSANYSLAAALGALQSAVGFVLISVSYYLAYRLTGYRIF